MAIEANQFTEKDNLIARFYTLRAGLSAISEETQKIKTAQKELTSLKEQNNSNNLEIQKSYEIQKRKTDDLMSTLTKKRDDAIKIRDSYKQDITEAESKLRQLKEDKKEYQNANPSAYGEFEWGLFFKILGINYIVWLIIIFIFNGLFKWIIEDVISIIVENLSKVIDKNTLEDIGMALFAAFMIFIFFVIPIWISLACKKSDGRATISNRLKETNEAIETTKMRLDIYTEGYKRSKEDIAKYDEEFSNMVIPLDWQQNENLDMYKEKIDSLENDLNNKIIPASTEKAKAIKEALINQLSDILTEDDWRHVDLLIFYLNTGRADSLKEALLLVDRQAQTDQIVDALNTSARYISNTIRDNTFRLAKLMDNCFSRLSRQIDKNHFEMVDSMRTSYYQMEKSIENINEINSNLQELGKTIEVQGSSILSAEQLNASLLKQANQSSENLIRELRYNQRYWNT